MFKRILFSSSAVLCLLTTSTGAAAAQTTGDQVLYACYIPLVGVVYRIKAPGLPQACLAKSHVEFQWNAQGPKGDRGDTGPAGNLALAGQNCPLGYFVTGFNSGGGLVCRNTSGDEPPVQPPPPPPPSPFNGTWTISPTLSSNCTAAGLNGSINVTGLTTFVNSPNQLTLSPTGFVSFLGGTYPMVFGGASVAITDPPTFPLAVVASGTASPTSGIVLGQIGYNINGSFSSLTSFSAGVILSNLDHLSITLPGAGTVSLVCGQIAGTVTGSRAQ